MVDDGCRSFGKVHRLLSKSHAFDPWDEDECRCAYGQEQRRVSRLSFHDGMIETILTSASDALAQGLQVLPPIGLFFGDYGISPVDLSLVRLTKKVWAEWKHDSETYSKLSAEMDALEGTDDDFEDDDNVHYEDDYDFEDYDDIYPSRFNPFH